MTKARTLANFISDGSPLADGTISVSEVSGAAPLASPTFTGTASGTFSGPLTGNVTGNLTGNVTGAVTGDVTAPEIDLSAIAATISDTAVDVFVYDTRKDSDGGAWRKRTQGTSWYNETLNTATRGSRKEFPSVVVIVLETNKTVIYDGDDPDMPMWMTFVNAGANSGVMLGELSNKCVTMLNGIIAVGSSPYDLYFVNFIKDNGGQYSNNAAISGYYRGNILQRNVTTMGFNVGTLPNIIDRTINDVAMTVLPNAPIDAATGLPVPTIAVATAGGTSVIRDDGTVVDVMAGTNAFGVEFTKDHKLLHTANDANSTFSIHVRSIPSSDTTSSASRRYNHDGSGGFTTPPISGISNESTSKKLAILPNHTIASATLGSSTTGGKPALNLLQEVPNAPTTGKVAYVTSSYNTGWMNGDIKLATLSDTDATNVTGAELVTGDNSTFTNGIGDWYDNSYSSTLTNSGGYLTMNNTTSYQQAVVTISNALVVGKTYVWSWDQIAQTSSNFRAFINSDTLTVPQNATGSFSMTFVATSTDLFLKYKRTATSGTCQVDNISVRLAEEDRSVNGNGLQVFGTVTKSAVATGADLVAYSGFSTSNYLAQPYNSGLDFGTGDFSYMGWVKWVSGTGYLFDRADTSGSRRVAVYPNSNGAVTFYTENGYVTAAASTLVTNIWSHVTLVRRSGLIYGYHNGVQVIVPFADTGSKTSADGSALFKAGVRFNSVEGLDGSIALLRASATAPSPEQIKKIYEDEKHLFQENAQATLYGSSDAVTALAHDDSTDLLHVGTSAGRSVFQGLRRVDNTTTAVGAAISASNGLVADE